jgi:adenylosuccinate lyase
MNHNPYNNWMKNILLTFSFSLCLFSFSENQVADVFKSQYRNQLFMDVESALAQAQAELEIIPKWAADEIKLKADVKYLKQKDIDKEQSLVRHTLVARLNVWKRSITHLSTCIMVPQQWIFGTRF